MADINFDRITNDILLNDGDLAFTQDFVDASLAVSEGIRQDLIARLYTFQGEYFLDESGAGYGSPWYQQILTVKPLPLEQADKVVRRIILGTNGVASVEQILFNFDRSDRSLDITFVAKTDAGQLIQDNIVLG